MTGEPTHPAEQGVYVELIDQVVREAFSQESDFVQRRLALDSLCEIIFDVSSQKSTIALEFAQAHLQEYLDQPQIAQTEREQLLTLQEFVAIGLDEESETDSSDVEITPQRIMAETRDGGDSAVLDSIARSLRQQQAEAALSDVSDGRTEIMLIMAETLADRCLDFTIMRDAQETGTLSPHWPALLRYIVEETDGDDEPQHEIIAALDLSTDEAYAALHGLERFCLVARTATAAKVNGVLKWVPANSVTSRGQELQHLLATNNNARVRAGLPPLAD